MRARTAAAFVIGMAVGALGLGIGLWKSGALVTVKTPVNQAVAPASVSLPAPPASSLNDLLADAREKTPPPPTPPAAEPFDFSSSAPAVAPHEAPVPAAPPAVLIGPRPPATHGDADRIAPDRTTLPHLAMPLAGIDPHKINDTFEDARGGRKHEALDIMAPRGTPVLAVAEGNVAKLFTSKEGGLTVYQFDDTRTYCYYYAHLDSYRSGLQEGTLLRAGQVLGYVGSTGNASAKAPHLHFAVFRLGPEKKWWEGVAIDPLPMLR